MKRKIFLVCILGFLSSVIYSQQITDPKIQAKYHALNYEELSQKGLNSKSFVETTPPAGPVRNIAEFEPNQGVIISYANNFGIPATLIRALAEYVHVYVVCANNSTAQNINTYFINNNVNTANVSYVIAPIDSYWSRDYSPWFIEYTDNHVPGIVNFPYNRPRPNDNDIPIVFGNYLGLEVFGMNVVHTGGNYMCDGYGVAASTDLVYEENTNLTSNQIMQKHLDYLGISNYHLVPDPLGDYIKHIDCWGKFLDVDKILITSVPATNPQYAEYEAMADYWANQTSSYGTKYKVYRTYSPNGQPYSNSLIMNNKVFIPFVNGSGSSYNSQAADVYAQALLGYQIIGINYDYWYSTDALHCRTHEVPDLQMLRVKHIPYHDTIEYQDLFMFSAEVYSFSNSNAINSVKLYYKVNDQTTFSELAMQNIGNNNYFCSLSFNFGDEVYYYIEATDSRPHTEYHPYLGSVNPHHFVISDPYSIAYQDEMSYVKAYPNPATEQLFVVANNINQNIQRIEIVDLTCKIVKTVDISKTSFDWDLLTIDISELPSQLYVLKLVSDQKIFLTRFVKY